MPGNPTTGTADPLDLCGRAVLDGRYLVRERIAHGGMSVVYRADDERLHRSVCVKVFYGIDPRCAVYQTSYEHFVQEAFALSQLSHPHTIRIYDFGYLDEAPRSPLYVSEFLGGGTLRDLVRREGPLELRATLDILTPIVGALSEAHGRGIVHRDLKPTNILFGSAGGRRIAKLADFGIAKAAADQGTPPIPYQARDTDVKGKRIAFYSPGWAAPEQLRAQPMGPTGDVFALGLLCAYMLTGKKIYSDRDAEAFERRAEGDAYVERAVAALGVPPDVAAVIVRACRMDPAARYSTVEAFLAALRVAAAASPEAPSALPPLPPPPEERVAAQPSAGLPTSPLSSAPLLAVVATTPPSAIAAVTAPSALGAPSPPSAPGAAMCPPGFAGAAAPPSVAAPLPSAPGAAASPPALTAGTSPSGASEPPSPPLVLSPLAEGEFVAAGRRLRIVPVADQRDIGPSALPFGAVRLRATLLPGPGDSTRLHLKGLNCFLVRPGGRPTGAVETDVDTLLTLVAPDRTKLDEVRCLFGTARDGARVFSLQGAAVAVPTREARRPVLLDFGPGRELLLVCRPAARPPSPGRAKRGTKP